MTAPSQSPGLVFGMVLSTAWAELALKDAALATRTRRANGLPETATHSAYVEALAQAVAAAGRADVRATVDLQRFPEQKPTVPIREGAMRLQLSERQVRRRAEQGHWGARKIGRQYFLDDELIREQETA